MTSPVSIALSGLQAASTRVGAAASNIANAHTSGARGTAEGPQPYIPVDVVQTSNGGGVAATIVERDPGTVDTYSPDTPYADEQGYIARPDIDLINEALNVKAAANAYAANAAVVRVASEMERELLDRFDETV